MTALVGFEFEFAGPDRRRGEIMDTLADATGRDVFWGGSPTPDRPVLVLGTDATAATGRLSGYEIRTPPLPPAEAFDLARRIAAWVRDHPDLARTHATTGVHVTIDADDPYLLAGLLLLREFHPAAADKRKIWAHGASWEDFVDCVLAEIVEIRRPAPQILASCADILNAKYSALHRRREGLWELRWPGGEGWEDRIEPTIRQVASILRRSAMAARYGLRAIEAALRATARRHDVTTSMSTDEPPDGRVVARMVENFRRRARRMLVDELLHFWSRRLPPSVRRHNDVLDMLVTRVADVPLFAAGYYSDPGRDWHGQILEQEPELIERLLDRVLRIDDPEARTAAVMVLFLPLSPARLADVVERLLDAGATTPAVRLMTYLRSIPDAVATRVLPAFVSGTGLSATEEQQVLRTLLFKTPVETLRRLSETLGRIVQRLVREGREQVAETVYDLLADLGVQLSVPRPTRWHALVRTLLSTPHDNVAWERLGRAVESNPDAARVILDVLPDAVAEIRDSLRSGDPMAPLLVAIAGGDPRRTGWRPPSDDFWLSPRFAVPFSPYHAVPLVRRGIERLLRTLPAAVPAVIARLGLHPAEVLDEQAMIRLLTGGHLSPRAWAHALYLWSTFRDDPVWTSPRVLRTILTRPDLPAEVWRDLELAAHNPRFRTRLEAVLREVPGAHATPLARLLDTAASDR